MHIFLIVKSINVLCYIKIRHPLKSCCDKDLWFTLGRNRPHTPVTISLESNRMISLLRCLTYWVDTQLRQNSACSSRGQRNLGQKEVLQDTMKEARLLMGSWGQRCAVT